MKNRLRSLAAALACLFLLSCASGDGKSPDPAAEEPFVFPEDTGTLVLYSEKTNHKRMQQAINLFGELYPDVKIDLQVLDQDAFYNRLRTEIPAGTGPDVIWETSTYLPDVYKTMAAGVFADLNPYFLNDETFSFGDYVEGVLDGVLIQGKRYIVPLDYEYYAIISSEEALAEFGIDREQLTTYEGFLDTCLTVKQNDPDVLLQSDLNFSLYLNSFIKFANIRFYDPETNELDIDRDQIKLLADVAKLSYDCDGEDRYSYSFPDGSERPRFMWVSYRASDVPGLAFVELFYGRTPVVLPYPTASGKRAANVVFYCAVPVGAENKLNAYRFVKALLSEEYQGAIANGKVSDLLCLTPVRRESVREMMARSSRLNDPTNKYADFWEEANEEFYWQTTDIEEVGIIRTYVYNSVKGLLKTYATGKIGFDKMYDKLINVLTLYRDE